MPTEAQMMESMAISLGVPKEVIIQEDNALSTMDNGYFTKPILDQTGITHITVVTSDFHMLRSKMIFQRIYQRNNSIYVLKFLEDHPTLSEKQKTKEYEVEHIMTLRCRDRLTGDGFW